MCPHLRFGHDRLFLDLYATGVRLTDPSKVQVLIGGEPVTPLFAGAQPQYAGLDQVTLELPRSLAGRGRVEVTVVADGVRANSWNFILGDHPSCLRAFAGSPTRRSTSVGRKYLGSFLT